MSVVECTHEFIKRALSFLLAIAAGLMAYVYYLEFSLIGFPDGHLTRLERISEPLYLTYVSASLLFFFVFLGFGIAYLESNFKWALFAFFLFACITYLMRLILPSLIAHGQGG